MNALRKRLEGWLERRAIRWLRQRRWMITLDTRTAEQVLCDDGDALNACYSAMFKDALGQFGATTARVYGATDRAEP